MPDRKGFGLKNNFHKICPNQKKVGLAIISFHWLDLADQVTGISFGELHLWTEWNDLYQFPISGDVHIRPMWSFHFCKSVSVHKGHYFNLQ